MAMLTGYKHLVLVKEELGKLYSRFNNRKFVHPDPLEFLYRYEDLRDREIVGLLASSLAYGRVNQILTSVSSVLEKMKPCPFVFLKESSFSVLEKTFSDFRYRFTTGEELSNLLFNVKCIIEEYGSLELCFMEGFKESDETVIPALVNFSEKLCSYCTYYRYYRYNPSISGLYDCNDQNIVNYSNYNYNSFSYDNLSFNNPDSDTLRYNSLVPLPGGRSAFKRLNLFLRWMVRKDNVDPGGWNRIPSSKLVIPVDTHMYRICVEAGLTERRQIDINTALEITRAFREIEPNDPVKYDFALTRLAILRNS